MKRMSFEASFFIWSGQELYQQKYIKKTAQHLVFSEKVYLCN